MKKYLKLLVVVFALVFALTACSGGGEVAETKTEKVTEVVTEAGDDGVKSLKLASHNAVIEGNPYRVRYEQDIKEAAAAALDHGFDISYSSFVSNFDAATETQQIQNSINEGYDIILVNPVAPTGLDPVIEKAQDAGIIYINADCEYTSEAVDIINVVTDQYYLGHQTATVAGEVLGEGAKVVMINALDGNQANTDRSRGFLEAIEEQGLEVVGTYNHDWDPTLAQQIMTEILSSGVEFDGVLTSQCAENCLMAFDATGTDYPKFLGFGDTGEFMQRMLKINEDEVVLPYVVVSNPPGVGATALNFGINMLMGKEIRDDIYTNEATHAIHIPSRIWYTEENQEEYRDLAESMDPGDAITFWLTIDEVAAEYFK